MKKTLTATEAVTHASPNHVVSHKNGFSQRVNGKSFRNVDMDEHEGVRAILFECTITNNYSGLEVFRTYAKNNPGRAVELSWQKIAECSDNDDGSLVMEILSILASVDIDGLRNRLHQEWGSIDLQHRQVIITAAARNDVLPLSDWLALFDDERSSVNDRHRLVAAIASGAYSEEFRPYAARYIGRIGSYSEQWHNEILLGLISRLRQFYGIS